MQSLLIEVSPLLQGLFIQLDAPVSLIVQKAGQRHPVLRHVAPHGKKAQDKLPVRLLQSYQRCIRSCSTDIGFKCGSRSFLWTG